MNVYISLSTSMEHSVDIGNKLFEKRGNPIPKMLGCSVEIWLNSIRYWSNHSSRLCCCKPSKYFNNNLYCPLVHQIILQINLHIIFVSRLLAKICLFQKNWYHLAINTTCAIITSIHSKSLAILSNNCQALVNVAPLKTIKALTGLKQGRRKSNLN